MKLKFFFHKKNSKSLRKNRRYYSLWEALEKKESKFSSEENKKANNLFNFPLEYKKDSYDSDNYLSILNVQEPNSSYIIKNTSPVAYVRKGNKKINPLDKSLLMISIGNPYFQGKHLLSIVNFINKGNFTNLEIKIADVLNRYNIIYSKKCSTKDAFYLSKQQCQSYLQSEKEILNNIKSNNLKVIFFEESLFSKEYLFARDQVELLYITEQEFKNSVDFVAEKIISKKKEKGHLAEICKTEEEKIKNLNILYLKEECAEMLDTWPKNMYSNIIYPGGLNIAQKYIFNKLIKPINPAINFHQIHFKNEKAFNSNNVNDSGKIYNDLSISDENIYSFN